MSKEETIKAINSFKNTPIAPQKKDVVENSSGTNHQDLMQYNAMLDNITIGPHTNTTINFAGIDWTLRLLTAEEYVDIRVEVDKKCRESEVFADYFIAYHTMVKILARALTPSPFKTEGKTIFSENDLRKVNFDVMEAIYIQYIDFVGLATQKPTEFTDEQIEGLFNIAKKKPELLRELERPKLQAITAYAINYSLALEKIAKSDMNNTSSSK